MLIARLDYELIQRFTLTIIARDGGGEETTGRVRINVLDVNDNVPTFQKDAYVGALRENEPSVTQLVRLRVRTQSVLPPSPPPVLPSAASACPPSCGSCHERRQLAIHKELSPNLCQASELSLVSLVTEWGKCLGQLKFQVTIQQRDVLPLSLGK